VVAVKAPRWLRLDDARLHLDDARLHLQLLHQLPKTEMSAWRRRCLCLRLWFGHP
jgi:hypothetical protein